MNNSQVQTLTEVKRFVTEFLENKIKPLFVFHNFEHTQKVVNAVDEMSRHYHLNDNDRFILLLSGWFHDTGLSTGRIQEHEKESIRLAQNFLLHRIDSENISCVSSCIQATHIPQSPKNLIEQIMCDADLYHLGTSEFKKLNDRLKQEQQTYFAKSFSTEEWCQRNIDFLKSHKYFTDYCQQKLEPVKQRWIKQFEKIGNNVH